MAQVSVEELSYVATVAKRAFEEFSENSEMRHQVVKDESTVSTIQVSFSSNLDSAHFNASRLPVSVGSTCS